MNRILVLALSFSIAIFPLFSSAGQGDFDSSGSITIEDAIGVLQAVTAVPTDSPLDKQTEISGDDKFGTAEAIFVLQYLSGLRPDRDVQPPSVPTDIQALVVSPSQIDLTWNACTDNVGVVGYEVYMGETKVGASASTSFSDTELVAKTAYCYTVLAYDNAFNRSSQSSRVCAETQDARIALDDTGTVRSTITVAGPAGSYLTLYAGTRIALVGTAGNLETPDPSSGIYLSLADPPAPLPALPAGIEPLSQVHIAIFVDGIERDAYFWSGSTDTTAPQGLKLKIVFSDPFIDEAIQGLLFEASSEKAVRVDSSALEVVGEIAYTPCPGSADTVATTARSPLEAISSPAAAGASTSPQMQFSPKSTGTYIGGGAVPGTGAAPGETFWSSFTIADPGCIDLGTTQVCGPCRVDRIEILEESTGEFLGTCRFGDSDTATTGSLPPGYQFWCERIRDPSGTTEIKVSSMQANLPQIHAYLRRIEDDRPMWEIYTPPVGGLNGPDGTIYSDPYQHKELEFPIAKRLIFVTSVQKDINWMMDHTLRPLREAGYSASLSRFSPGSPGVIADICVGNTLDGRVLLEDNVILKDDTWKVRSGREDTRGNRGTYDYSPKYKGTVKASLSWPPPYEGVMFWEITGEVTFEKDEDSIYRTPEYDVYTTCEGTITQTVYSVADPSLQCYGEPVSFTDTYPVYRDDGLLFMRKGTDPAEYRAAASISALTPVQTHFYQECCPYRQALQPPEPVCRDHVLEIDEQEHQWMYTGTTDLKAQTDGSLKGTYQDPNVGTYEWVLAPLDGAP